MAPLDIALCNRLVDLLGEIDTYFWSEPRFNELRLILLNEAVRLQHALFLDTCLEKQENLAYLLVNLGVAFGRSHRNKDACTADQAAHVIRRETYRLSPSTDRPKLANLLYNYGSHLHACGRFKESRAADAEAAKLYKTLYEADSHAWRKSLADVLFRRAFHLYAVQRFEDARKVYEDALVHHRKLFKSDPAAHGKSLADCLNNYSNTLDDLGLM